MHKNDLFYLLIRACTLPFRFLPYRAIHWIGKGLGRLLFYCLHEYRKRALSNIALAQGLSLTPKERIRVVKQSFENLAINCLEYPRLARGDAPFLCENPEVTDRLYAQGQGIVFFCGHQSNWELLFLDGTLRMKGIAIGKSIKNKRLYQWIVSIREQNGGKIVAPSNAIREGLRALKKGAFVGIVGDQGMPDSGYSSSFLGRNAWTSTAPALLAYRTNSPIVFAATRRVRGRYRIRYSEPIWPNLSKSIEEEIPRLMGSALALLEESVKQNPGEWLWQHNRWKQQSPKILYKEFRHDSICLLLPEEPAQLEPLLPHLQTFREMYPLDFLFLIAPLSLQGKAPLKIDGAFYYSHLEEALLSDYRFKLVFNFTQETRFRAHYKRLSAFHVLDLPTLRSLAAPHLPPDQQDNLSTIFKRALCRPGSLWKQEV